MAKCQKCGKRGLFLKLTNGMCSKCASLKTTDRHAESDNENAVSNEAIVQDSQMFQTAKRISEALEKELKFDNTGNLILQEIITHGLIDGVSDDTNQKASEIALQNLSNGRRPEALAKELIESTQSLDYDTAYTLMRTKCGIASAAKNKIKQTRMGLKWYIWKTANDQRVRPEHRILEGVICNWNDAPNPKKLYDGSMGECVHPGYEKECRCIDLAVISPDDVKLPAKLHIAGKIITVSNKDDLLKFLNG